MIPLDKEEAMRSGIYISGQTGTGKSDVAMYAADELKKDGVLVVTFDPTQDWQNRSSLDKVYAPNMQDYTWRGKWQQETIIFDMSQLTIVEQQAFVEDFCKLLMTVRAEQYKKGIATVPIFLIFEEAHTYFPEGCMRSKAYRNTVRMMTQGRNYGIRFCCITQFASLIDKNAMRYMRQRYFGYTDEPNDTEYILRMFGKKFKEQAERYLRQLNAGEFLYKCGYSLDLIKIEPYQHGHKPETVEPTQPENIKPISENKATVKTETIIKIAITLLWIFIITWVLTR